MDTAWSTSSTALQNCKWLVSAIWGRCAALQTVEDNVKKQIQHAPSVANTVACSVQMPDGMFRHARILILPSCAELKLPNAGQPQLALCFCKLWELKKTIAQSPWSKVQGERRCRRLHRCASLCGTSTLVEPLQTARSAEGLQKHRRNEELSHVLQVVPKEATFTACTQT